MHHITIHLRLYTPLPLPHRQVRLLWFFVLIAIKHRQIARRWRIQIQRSYKHLLLPLEQSLAAMCQWKMTYWKGQRWLHARKTSAPFDHLYSTHLSRLTCTQALLLLICGVERSGWSPSAYLHWRRHLFLLLRGQVLSPQREPLLLVVVTAKRL